MNDEHVDPDLDLQGCVSQKKDVAQRNFSVSQKKTVFPRGILAPYKSGTGTDPNFHLDFRFRPHLIRFRYRPVQTSGRNNRFQKPKPYF
jgi:hypothetical protein